ncbi:unnamed protein product [Agarophyton chilense]
MAALRKRLLARWRLENAGQSELDTASASRKRARPAFHDDRPPASQRAANAADDALRGKRRRNGAAAPRVGVQHEPTTEPTACAPGCHLRLRLPATTTAREGRTDGCDDAFSSAACANTNGDTCGGVSKSHSPRNVQSRRAMVGGESGTRSSSRRTEQLQRQIEALSRQRWSLEQSVFEEICSRASEMRSNCALGEQRLQLKADIGKLSAEGVRDLLVHLARRCSGFEIEDHEEVLVRTDLLSPALVAEIGLIVMMDKGLVHVGAHAELRKVRTSLGKCLEE